jgi:hypothetical protein
VTDLPRELLDPLLANAHALAAQRPRQELLSGIHNPFGRTLKGCDPWKFLDVCESAVVCNEVAALIGPDIVLWDSEFYLDAAGWEVARAREGRYWPADPLAGAVVDVALAMGAFTCREVRAASAPAPATPGAHYVIRYMPATSLYNRDPLYEPNRLAMEERPLVNYLNRPLWLVRGEDRAGSDFAAGFQNRALCWAVGTMVLQTEV